MAENNFSIRIQRDDVKRITVNDNGDYIEISLKDTGFYKRFKAMVEWFEVKQKALEKVKIDDDDTEAIIEMSDKLFTEVGEQIDKLFGEGTCHKVFGDMSLNADVVMQFFEQLTDILKKLSNDRAKDIKKKYTRPKLVKA